MEKPYIINIENGIGQKTIANGTYEVTANVNGYNNDSINPQTLEVTSTKNEYNLKISAEGSLTIHVTEEGTQNGTPVPGAIFYRTDSNGTTYGSPVTTDLMGNAILDNLPFAEINAPVVYFKQVNASEEYLSNNEVMEIRLTEQDTTIEITNAKSTPRTFILTDANYENLPINNGSITLS